MKYFYVTGASRGLGRAIAEHLLQDEGHYVIGIARGDGPRHERYRHVHLDLADVTAVKAFQFDPLPHATHIVLVNNAAMMAIAHIGAGQAETIVEALTVNMIAPALLMNAFVATYEQSNADLVVCNLSSAAAERAVDGGMLYCGSKAGLSQMTRVGTVEVGMAEKRKLTFLAIAPGSVDTEMQAYLRSLDPAEYTLAITFRQRYQDGHVLSPSDVAARLCRILMNPEKAPAPVFNLDEVPR